MAKLNAGTDCYLGLGSNLNKPIQQIKQAIFHIAQLPKTTLINSAPWYQSKAWGVIEQNDFINTVIQINTLLPPLALLKAVKIIEYRLMQRQVNLKWHARIIDIDLLIYGHKQLNRPELTLPHPHLKDRCFVIEPLMSLQPKLNAQLKKDIVYHQQEHKCRDSLKPVRSGIGLEKNKNKH